MTAPVPPGGTAQPGVPAQTGGPSLPPPASAGGTSAGGTVPPEATVRAHLRYLADHDRLSWPVDLTAPSWWRPQ